ncbi:MAG: hypothetical protein ACK53Y_03510, partial [bacterium]
LRLTNLEKQFRKQDQKINEKFKSLTKDKEAQKNFIGSYLAGSIASPELQTLPPQKHLNNKKRKSQQKVIDLSKEDAEDTSHHQHNVMVNVPPRPYRQSQKKQKGIRGQNHHISKKEKAVHWNETG